MSAVCCMEEMEWNGVEWSGQGRCDERKKYGEELNEMQGMAGIKERETIFGDEVGGDG
jgi:hypothetical protein